MFSEYKNNAILDLEGENIFLDTDKVSDFFLNYILKNRQKKKDKETSPVSNWSVTYKKLISDLPRLSNFLSKNINHFRNDFYGNTEDEFTYNDFSLINAAKRYDRVRTVVGVDLARVGTEIFSNIEEFGTPSNTVTKKFVNMFSKFINYSVFYYENPSIDSYPSLSFSIKYPKGSKNKVLEPLLGKVSDLETLDETQYDLPELEDGWMVYDNNSGVGSTFNEHLLEESDFEWVVALLSKISNSSHLSPLEIKNVLSLVEKSNIYANNGAEEIAGLKNRLSSVETLTNFDKFLINSAAVALISFNSLESKSKPSFNRIATPTSLDDPDNVRYKMEVD